MNAELLSYSRTKGLFAGIDLDGTSVSQNKEDTELYYGAPHTFEAILRGERAGSSRGRVSLFATVAHNFVPSRENASR